MKITRKRLILLGLGTLLLWKINRVKQGQKPKRIRKSKPKVAAAWGGGQFKHFSSVVSSSIKAANDDEYKPTAWELLQDSIRTQKIKNKFGKDEKDDKEDEEKSLTLKEKIEMNEMNERERALLSYFDKRN